MREALIRGLFGFIYVVVMWIGVAHTAFTFHLLFGIIGILSLYEMWRLTEGRCEIIAFLYIGIPLVLIHSLEQELILLMFLVTWTFDTFAYLIGVNFGKKRILKIISPKKSWEGFLGGLICTILISWFFFKPIIINQADWYYPSLYHLQWLLEDLDSNVFFAFICLIPFSATIGDLIESYYKRKSGVKDSGNLIPGHGGVLDRMDAFFITIPILYIYTQFI